MADIATGPSLQELLAGVLPKDVPFTFYHYSTPPTRSTAVFNAPPHRKPERTYCESHLLAVSIAPKEQDPDQSSQEILILAIEVLIYTTKDLTTVFVSKADSTGYIAELKLSREHTGSPLKAICGTFVSWLVRERQREGKKLVVSLFARAQAQYLFPASVENKDKHVLDDWGLVRWWCKVLDPLVSGYGVEADKKQLGTRLAESANGNSSETPSRTAATTAKGYLVIPGIDPYDTLRYTPSPAPGTPRRWAAGHPLLQIAPYPAAPPRCLVPHFPDDPKSRFLDELDEELPDARTDELSQIGGTPSRSNGQWKSVKTLEQFWEMMAFRQECSSGRIVGFIWVVITPPEPSIREEDEETEPLQSRTVTDTQTSFASTVSSVGSEKNSPRKSRRRRVEKRKTGPIPLLIPRILASSSNLSSSSVGSNSATSKLPSETSPYYKWPASSRGTLLLSANAYNRAHEILIQQNFATRNAAAKSTKKWLAEVAVLAGSDSWGWTVIGKKEVSAPKADANGAAPVTLMAVKKKRKADAPPAAATNGVNTLGAGLVRKKPKN